MKILFISTNSFPYDRKETLLESKVLQLSTVFDLIFILSATDQKTEEILLPRNVYSVSVNLRMNYLNKLFALFGFFSKLIFLELIHQKQSAISWSKLKVALNSFYHSKRYLKKVFELCNLYDLKNGNNFFYFHSYWCTDFPIAFSSLREKFPNAHFSTRMHAYDLYEERHSPSYLPFRKKIFETCDKLFFISEQGKEYFRTTYSISENNKLKVNYLGVDIPTSVFQPILSNQPELVIVSCSSLIPLKRVHLIIQSLSMIDDICIYWIHFGNGPLWEELLCLASEQLSHKENIRFEFKGYLANHTILSFYSSLHVDLFANVSHYEGVPISIMEAMSCGIPCIGTDVGGVNEIITEKNGFLVDVNFKPALLASVIENYFKLKIDEKLAYRKNAMQLIESRFNKSHNIDSFIKEVL